jgi:hypothetical protein
MKKAFLFLVALAISVPVLVNAVTLTGESNVFSFPGDAVRYQLKMNASEVGLRALSGINNGSITIQYILPKGIKSANLSIYNVAGARVDVLSLSANSNSIRWAVSKNKIPTGIYLAVLRTGSVEKRIQISVVK